MSLKLKTWQDSLQDWEEKNTRDDRRASGSVWTPMDLSAWMADWLKEIHPAKVLDPAGGCGNLLECFEDPFDPKNEENRDDAIEMVTAEIDPALREVLKDRLPGAKVYDNFWELPEREMFDAVIANPPYINHSHIENKEILHRRLSKEFGVDFPKSSNLALLFYLEAWRRLRIGGRMIFLIPTEFMQVTSGKKFKEWLTDTQGGQVTHIVDLTSKDLFGKDVVSTACLVLAEKTSPKKVPEEVLFSTHTGVGPFPSWENQEKKAKRVKRDEINHDTRWGSDRETGHKGKTQKLSELLDISSGHITGNNSLFLISYPEAVRRGLENSVSYCLIRPHQLPTPFFHTREQIEELKQGNSKRWLVCIGNKPNKVERAYLDEAEELGLDQTATFQGRDPWWNQGEAIQVDFAIPNFRRSRYKIVSYLDHGRMSSMPFYIVPNLAVIKENYVDMKEAIFMWLCSKSGQKALRSNERDAGNGLYTIRSGALKQVDIPFIQDNSSEWKKSLKTLYSELKTVVLSPDSKPTDSKGHKKKSNGKKGKRRTVTAIMADIDKLSSL